MRAMSFMQPVLGSRGLIQYAYYAQVSAALDQMPHSDAAKRGSNFGPERKSRFALLRHRTQTARKRLSDNLIVTRAVRIPGTGEAGHRPSCGGSARRLAEARTRAAGVR